MCAERYLIEDEVYFFYRSWPAGPVNSTLKIDLPLYHPDADFLEMQILGVNGKGIVAAIHTSSQVNDEKFFLAIESPSVDVAGVQLPVGRRLRGMSALWLTVFRPDDPDVEGIRASVAVRLFGKRQGGCRG